MSSGMPSISVAMQITHWPGLKDRPRNLGTWQEPMPTWKSVAKKYPNGTSSYKGSYRIFGEDLHKLTTVASRACRAFAQADNSEKYAENFFPRQRPLRPFPATYVDKVAPEHIRFLLMPNKAKNKELPPECSFLTKIMVRKFSNMKTLPNRKVQKFS